MEREFKGGDKIGYIFRELKDITIELPPKPTGVMDDYDKVIWSNSYKEKSEKKAALEELKSMAFALVLGQSSPGVVLKLEGQTGFSKV